jgi:uncharacterized damage-inducible protein DinB
MSIAEGVVRDFNLETEFSRRLLEAVPADKLDWQPHEESMTLGQLAGHVAEAPSWVFAMGELSFDMADAGDGGEYVPFVPSNSGELMSTFEENAKGFGGFLAERDDEFMNETWTMSAGGKEILSLPRDAAIRSILIHHISHHRGQLTVYLRMLGVAVPPTYGPTADHPDPS